MKFQISKRALDFSRLILQDEKEVTKSNIEKPPLISSQEINNPLRRVNEINYANFELLAKQIEEEEPKAPKEPAYDIASNPYNACSHDHSKEEQIYNKPTSEKLEATERYRVLGNEAFNDKNYGLAAVNYRKALIQLDYTFPDTPDENERFNKLKLIVSLNMCAVKILLDELEEALIHCGQALEIDPNNPKALYRRGLIYLKLDKHNKALKALNAALVHAPDDSTILDTINTLNKQVARHKQKSRESLTKMFQGIGMSDDSGCTSEKEKDYLEKKSDSKLPCENDEKIEKLHAKEDKIQEITDMNEGGDIHGNKTHAVIKQKKTEMYTEHENDAFSDKADNAEEDQEDYCNKGIDNQSKTSKKLDDSFHWEVVSEHDSIKIYPPNVINERRASKTTSEDKPYDYTKPKHLDYYSEAFWRSTYEPPKKPKKLSTSVDEKKNISCISTKVRKSDSFEIFENEREDANPEVKETKRYICLVVFSVVVFIGIFEFILCLFASLFVDLGNYTTLRNFVLVQVYLLLLIVSTLLLSKRWL